MLNEREMGPSREQMRFGFLLAFLSAAVAIPVVGILAFEKPTPGTAGFFVRGPYFWPRLIWCEIVLAVLCLGGAWQMGGRLLRQRQQTGSAIVVQLVLITKACYWSLALLLASVFLPDNMQHWEVIAQALLLVITFGLLASLTIARGLQTHGQTPIPPEVKRPDELVALLASVEPVAVGSSPGCVTNLKSLKDRINYSLPRAGRIASSLRYREIAGEVQALCAAIESQKQPSAVNEHISRIDRKLALLLTELAGR